MMSKNQRFAGAIASGAIALAAVGGGVAVHAAGGKIPAAGGGGGGGGGGVVVVPPSPPPAATGGGAGAVNALMAPASPITAIGGANEDPTMPGAPFAAVPLLRFVPTRGVVSVSLVNMDPARYPIAPAGAVTSPCSGTITIDGVTTSGIFPAAATAPNVGSALGAHISSTVASPHTARLDLTCTVIDKRTKLPVTHQTHWLGSL